MNDRQDLFISHASEDKAKLVQKLATMLAQLGLKVWYDEFSLRTGDSLSSSIDRGLSNSDYGLVVLSPAFFSKGWTRRELEGLVALEVEGMARIIPIWHNVDKKDVLKQSPTLADKLAIVSSGQTISHIAMRVLEAVRPDLYNSILKKRVWFEALEKSVPVKIPIKKIKKGPIRSVKLSTHQLLQIALLQECLQDVFPSPMKDWVDSFRRDMHPDNELEWWEHLAAMFVAYCRRRDGVSQEEARSCFGVLFNLKGGAQPLESDIVRLDVEILIGIVSEINSSIQ